MNANGWEIGRKKQVICPIELEIVDPPLLKALKTVKRKMY